MKNNLLFIIFVGLGNTSPAQSAGGVEHYYYMHNREVPAMVPIIHYNSSSNWYGEARYNYEDFNSLSIYGGKTFLKEGDISYSATPLVGGILGQMTGGSVGLNFDADHGKLFLSSQSQYSFSMEDQMNKYFFTWSEIGYQALPWCYAGVALQQTSMHKQNAAWETGYMIGFSVGKWTVPFYIFSASKQERYFILGVNWEWENYPKENLKTKL